MARFDRNVGGELGRLAEHCRSTVSAAQVALGGGPVPVDTSSRWMRFAEWALDTAKACDLPLEDVLERTVRGYANDPWIREQGWPCGALVGDGRKAGNPQKYFAVRRIGAAPPSRFDRPHLVAARTVTADEIDADWNPSTTEAAHG